MGPYFVEQSVCLKIKCLEGFPKTTSKFRGPGDVAKSNGKILKVASQAIDKVEDPVQDLTQVLFKLAVRWLWWTACEERKGTRYIGEHSEGGDEGRAMVSSQS